MGGTPIDLHAHFWLVAAVAIALLLAVKNAESRRWTLAGVNLAFLWLLLSQNTAVSNPIVVGAVCSFFVLRALHVARHAMSRIEPRPDVLATINYLVPFHNIIAGPIQPYRDAVQQSVVQAVPAAKDVMAGTGRIAVGLFKCLVLAYLIQAVLLTGFRSAGGYLFLEIPFYCIWLYLGFSGYSDIAMGIGRLAGVSPFAPRKSRSNAAFAERKATLRQLSFGGCFAIVTVFVLLAWGVGRFGFDSTTDSARSWSDSTLAGAELSPATKAKLGGRLAGVLCEFNQTPRQQRRPLGVVLGTSTAIYGICTSQLEAADPTGRRWLNLATEGTGFQGLFGGVELLLRSGLKADLVVMSVQPDRLATSAHRQSFSPADRPSAGRQFWTTPHINNGGWSIDNLLCQARQAILAGQPFEAIFPPAPRPWTSYVVESPDRCSRQQCQSQLVRANEPGWFDAGRNETVNLPADDFVNVIQRLRRRGVEVVVVLMPESYAQRSQIANLALARFTEAVQSGFADDPLPIVDLRALLPVIASQTGRSARPTSVISQAMLKELTAALECRSDERYRASRIGQESPADADRFSDASGQDQCHYALEPLGDCNRDGSPELAALIHDPNGSVSKVAVIELDTGRTVRQVNTPEGFEAIAIKSLQTDRPDLAWMLRHRATGEIETWIMDASTGQVSRRLTFGNDWTPCDMEVVPGAAGNGAQIAFLGTRAASGRSYVVVKQLPTEETVCQAELPADFKPCELEILPGLDGNGPSLAIAGVNQADGVPLVLVRPIAGGGVGRVVQLPAQFEPLDLEVLPGSPTSDLAVLGVENPSGAVRVFRCDPRSGSPTRRIDFPLLDAPRDLQVVPTADGRHRLAVLGSRIGTAEARVDVRESDTGALLDRLSFGTTFQPRRLAYFGSPSDQNVKFAALETQASPHQVRVHVKRGGTGTFFRSVPIFCDVAPDALPAWFDENRVQGHTRLKPGRWHRLNEAEFSLAAKGFKQLGARVFTRHVVWGDEDPWWPSAVPAASNGAAVLAAARISDGVFLAPGENLVQEFINAADREGVHLIAYYWHQADARIAKAHPEWIAKDFKEKALQHRVRGTYLDITGEYREVVLARLLELAAMGVSGFYFDSAQFPNDGCSDALKQSFARQTGMRPPVSATADTLLAWLDFKARKIEETLAYWRNAVHQQFPHVVFVISAERVESMTDRSVTTRQAAIGVPKSEYSKASDAHNKFFKENPDLYRPERDVHNAFGWTLLRDAAGRPPHIWSAGVPNRDHALAYVASLVTHGAVANMDVHEHNLLAAADPAESTPRAGLIGAFELGRRVSPHLARTKPVRFAAIHFSERARDHSRVDARGAWQQLHAPVIGAFGYFLRARCPVGIVSDAQISDAGLAGYKVLFLASPDALDATQALAVDRFAASGGLVIENENDWKWSDPRRRPEVLAEFRRRLAGTEAPVCATGGPQRLHAVAYRSATAPPRPVARRTMTSAVESPPPAAKLRQKAADPNRLVVALANDFSWVQLVKRNRPNPDRAINPAAPAVPAGVAITWKKAGGLPEVRDGHTLRASEAVSGQSLSIKSTSDGYKVVLPEFARMALVVVSETGNDRPRLIEANSGGSVEHSRALQR